jgi:membrane protein DedA with SNARE-associated domain
MYSMAEVFMWIMIGVLLGFTVGYTIGLKEGNRVGFVRGKISASKWANRS